MTEYLNHVRRRARRGIRSMTTPLGRLDIVCSNAGIVFYGQAAPRPGSGPAGTVPGLQLSVVESGRGRAERLWCLGDTPAAAGCGGQHRGRGTARGGAGEFALASDEIPQTDRPIGISQYRIT
jgi:hypothetical protein